VENGGSKPDNSGAQWNAVLVPVGSESNKSGNSSAQWRPVLTPIREETGETGDSSVQWNADLTPVKEGVIADVPVIDHATKPATILQSGGESEKRRVPGKSWNRNRAHSSAAWQRGNGGRKSSGTISANIHPVYDNNNPDTIISYSQMPPRNGVPLGSLRDQPAHIDFSLTPSPERPSFKLNPLAAEFVPASTDRDRQKEEVYSADWTVGENRPRRNRKPPNKFADFYMGKGNVCWSSTVLTPTSSIAIHNVKLCNAGRCITRRIQHSVASYQQQNCPTGTSSNATCEIARSSARDDCRRACATRRRKE